MITQNLSTLIINKLSAEQYAAALAAGLIKADELYLTPEEEIDLSGYLTKADAEKFYAIKEIEQYIVNLNPDDFYVDTEEIVIGDTNSQTAVLGKAKLGYMMLGSI